MFRRKKKRVVSFELNDFCIRALVVDNGDLATASVHEHTLSPGIVVDEIMKDELALFEVLKTVVKEWGIAKSDLTFFAQDHAVMMRTFTHPEEITTDKLKSYVEMELGQTIHLPFENPLIDVYDHNADDGEAVLFAAPSEEVFKLTQLFEDVHLYPTVLDVRTLSSIRFLETTAFFSPDQTYLIVDWSINAAAISIFSKGNVDYLRYQPAEKPSRSWRYNSGGNVGYTYDGDIEEYRQSLTSHIYEIERILNFYRFSLNKGEKAVDEIIMMGEHPEMNYLMEQTSSVLNLPIQVIDDAFMKKFKSQFKAKHAALVGLALKGGSS